MNYIGFPDIIFSVNDYIFLSEPKLDTLVSVYNISTGEFKRFLNKGNGPDESIDIQQIGQYNDSCVFVRSTFSRELFIYHINDTLSIHPNKVKVDEKSASSCFVRDFHIYPQHDKNRFAIDDMKNNIHSDFGSILSVKNCPSDYISYILTGLCSGYSIGNKFVWASFYGDLIEIYDYSDMQDVRLERQFCGTLPIISMSGNSPVFSKESKLGIVSITGNDKYIFALYCDNYIKDISEKKDGILFCNKILVYDWTGMPIKIIKTDKFIRSISYNKKQNKIHCIGYDEQYNIKVFVMDIFD
ncbi:MAG: TolB-like 6-bladed beta-propeller domain-containing protein [Dysgonamonadaceae bacterium]|jgi:hypothetical protein|nr:TolB-like 6-bladed beta-propeller domain-containing protein [Dysgonamonadaceae bacterium]